MHPRGRLTVADKRVLTARARVRSRDHQDANISQRREGPEKSLGNQRAAQRPPQKQRSRRHPMSAKFRNAQPLRTSQNAQKSSARTLREASRTASMSARSAFGDVTEIRARQNTFWLFRLNLRRTTMFGSKLGLCFFSCTAAVRFAVVVCLR